jgi:hypothetical protein
MQDLSALTPPLLMCAAVIIAIVAFLRHEMGRSRAGKSARGEDMPGPAPRGGEDLDYQHRDDTDASQTPRGES